MGIALVKLEGPQYLICFLWICTAGSRGGSWVEKG